MNTKYTHLSFETLADLVEDKQSSDARVTMLEHLDACADCATRFAKLESVVNLMRTDLAEDAPPELIARAINLLQPRAASTPSFVSSIASAARRVLATLSFDSAQLSPAYGVRSARATARQLIYTAGDHELDLRITPVGEGWVISGQIFGEECSGGRIELQGATDAVYGELNELCEFNLPSVTSDHYTLRLQLKKTEIEVSDLNLGA